MPKSAFFSRGNVWLALPDYLAAREDFRQVRQLAGSHRHLTLKAGLNLALAALLFEDFSAARVDLQRSAVDLQNLLDNDFAKIDHLLAWGLLVQDLHRHAAAAEKPPFAAQIQEQLLSQAEQAFRQALRLAEHSARARTRAYRRLGNLYEYRGRDREALALTRQAIFFAATRGRTTARQTSPSTIAGGHEHCGAGQSGGVAGLFSRRMVTRYSAHRQDYRIIFPRPYNRLF